MLPKCTIIYNYCTCKLQRKRVCARKLRLNSPFLPKQRSLRVQCLVDVYITQLLYKHNTQLLYKRNTQVLTFIVQTQYTQTNTILLQAARCHVLPLHLCFSVIWCFSFSFKLLIILNHTGWPTEKPDTLCMRLSEMECRPAYMCTLVFYKSLLTPCSTISGATLLLSLF